MTEDFLSEKVTSLPPSSIREFLRRARGSEGLIHLEIGEPDMDTPEHIREAAKEAMDEGYTHYTPFAGFEDLRAEISKKVRRENGIRADPEDEVIVTAGACGSVYCSILSVLNPGEEALIPDPGWPHYEPCVRMAGGKPVRYPQPEGNGFRADPEDLKGMMDERTKFILINSPNNPTGSVYGEEELRAIADLAVDNDILVITDEVYEEILHDGRRHMSIASLPGMFERTITINSLSKTYAMTGWRIGYTVARGEVISNMSELNLYTHACPNSVAQRAALAALEGPQDPVEEMVEEYGRRRDFIIGRLRGMEGVSCVTPEGAFYAFPNIGGFGRSSYEFAEYLLEEARVSVVPGSGFGPHGEGNIRISYANSMDNLEEAMDRMEGAVEGLENR